MEKREKADAFRGRRPFFYGWVIVAVTFVCFALGYSVWNSYSIFYVAILEEYGWSRANTAVAFSIFTIVYGLSAPAAGGLADRYGPRVIFPISAVVLGLGLLLTTQISSLLHLYIFFGVVASLGLSGIGTVPSFAVLNHWFIKKRGSATGIACSGIGIGALVLIPLWQEIINTHGWRAAYLGYALIVVSVIPALAIAFHRHRPRDIGELPDGENPSLESKDRGVASRQGNNLIVDKEWAAREWTVKSAMRTSRFWLIAFGRFLELTCVQMFLTHQAAYIVDAGFDKMQAASVAGFVGVVTSGATITWGVVSDRIGRELTYILAFSLGNLGVGTILLVGAGSPVWLLFVYAFAFGCCQGGVSTLTPVMAADIFQGRHFGPILGAVYTMGGLGASFGAFFAGYIFDVTSSYRLAFSLAIPGMWLICLLYWLAAPRKVRLVAGRVSRIH